MNGYAGSILHVDLTSNETKKEPLNSNIAEKFIGGFGLNAKLLYDSIEPGIDPLSPENAIVLGAGPLVGTIAPGATRIYAASKLPINNAMGWCGAGGMSFGIMLKNAGYDHIVIKGQAENPVYLKIFDDNVELCDASELWGMGTGETTDKLWNEFGRPLGVTSIGQGGEKLSRISMSFVDRASSLGRGGLGAVMGSKNLKAIITKGTKGISVSDQYFRK